jgi:hypothetical protein
MLWQRLCELLAASKVVSGRAHEASKITKQKKRRIRLVMGYGFKFGAK